MLNWEAPTQACDDATGNLVALSPGDLTGYAVNYIGPESGTLVIQGAATTAAEIDALTAGTYSITVCSLDAYQSCELPSTNCPSGSTSNAISATVP